VEVDRDLADPFLLEGDLVGAGVDVDVREDTVLVGLRAYFWTTWPW